MLADYINSYPDRGQLKINFKREQQGQYLFGTHRVNLANMQNRLKAKYAAGWIDIEEYMRQKLPSELAKLEMKDPLNDILGEPGMGQNNLNMSLLKR